MAYVTQSPVVLSQADRWDIEYFECHPGLVQFRYQLTTYNGRDVVNRMTVDVTDIELAEAALVQPQVANLYEAVMGALYAHAISKGLIPAEAAPE